MPYTIDAHENAVVITFTGLTLEQVQTYLATKTALLGALRWRLNGISGPGAGPFKAVLHRALTTGDQTALEQAMA